MKENSTVNPPSDSIHPSQNKLQVSTKISEIVFNKILQNWSDL